MKYNADAKYLHSLSCGDHEAFAFLYAKYRIPLVKFVNCYVWSEDIADDLIQDVFIKLWICRERMSNVTHFNAFIYRVARNAALDYLKGIATRRHYLRTYRPLPITSQMEEQYYATEISSLVEKVVRTMPPQRFRIFVMSRIDGLTNKEIASLLHISKKTVANHLHLALTQLRNQI